MLVMVVANHTMYQLALCPYYDRPFLFSSVQRGTIPPIRPRAESATARVAYLFNAANMCLVPSSACVYHQMLVLDRGFYSLAYV